MQKILRTDVFDLAADPTTGALFSFKLFGREMLLPQQTAGSDLALNGKPLQTRVVPDRWTNLGSYPSAGDAVNQMHACEFLSHYTGFGLDITRSLRATGPRQLHLTYTVQRTKIRTLPECPGPGWGAIEAPCHVTSLTMPCLPWKFFGDKTRMIAFNTGSAGPRNHLGYEHGDVAHVKAGVDTWFRRQYAGVMGFPGAIFYDVDSHHWLAITCRRPSIAYNLNHHAADQGIAFDFLPAGELRMSQTIQLPLVSFHAGDNRVEMDRFIATFMSQYYQEPADWFYRTTWFEMAMNPENFSSWPHAHQAAVDLTAKGAVSGLYLLAHGRNLAFGGTSPNTAGPCEELGARADFEHMVRDLRQRGVRLMMWMSSCGMSPQGDADPDWFVRGVDGDWLTAWGLPRQPHIVYINHLHPGYLAYVKRWLEYYLGELGMDAIFFDCAGFAYPFDYSPRPFMRYPSDLMLGNIRFFDFVRDTVARINPQAVIMTEGHCFDAFASVTSLNNVPAPEDGVGQRDRVLGFRHHGGKRFVVRSGFEGDLGSGYVVAHPESNYAITPDNAGVASQQYARIGNDPFNIALSRYVSQHGAQQAVNLPCGGGVSLLNDMLFVPQPRHESISPAALVPTARGQEKTHGVAITLPERFAHATQLCDQVTGQLTKREPTGQFIVRARGIFQIR